jgi:hypothetical protein
MKGSQEDEVERENENVFLDSSSPLRLDSFRVKQADFERNILIMTILSARKKNSSKMLSFIIIIAEESERFVILSDPEWALRERNCFCQSSLKRRIPSPEGRRTSAKRNEI